MALEVVVSFVGVGAGVGRDMVDCGYVAVYQGREGGEALQLDVPT